MPKKRESLGRGLSAILGNNTTKIATEIREDGVPLVGQTYKISISEIETNPFQPRIEFNQEKLHELAASIEQLGIIQPITVRKLQENKYQLISGERRFRASQLAGLNKIPSFVRIANDQEMLEMALVENIQRENLNPIDVALSFKRLIEECDLTQEACSERIGKNRTTITNFLRLLKLPEEIQLGLQEQKISAGHARALLSLKEKQSQINLFHDTIANSYTVREVEQMVKTFAESGYQRTSKEKTQRIKIPLPFDKQRKMHKLSNFLDREVELKVSKKGKGKLIIPFSSNEDFEKILGLIKENS